MLTLFSRFSNAAIPFHLPTTRALALSALLGGALLPVAMPGTARATSYYWLGNGANGNWNDAANWLGGVPANDLVNTDLFFQSSSSTSPIITPAYSIHSLTWSAGASAYTFGGSTLTLGAGGFNQNAANAQTFNAAVALGADQTWTLANGAGALTFNGGVNTTGPSSTNHSLTISAASTSGSGNVINGAITGSGSLTKTGAGTLTLTGASTYAGTTTVSAGTLAITGSLSSGGAPLLTVDGSFNTPPALNLSSTSSVSVGGLYIGYDQSGTGAQTGGSVTTSNLILGRMTDATGTYTLSGGSFSTGGADLGYKGSGTFTQTGGSFIASGSLSLGLAPGSRGTYVLSGGDLTTGDTHVGNDTAGGFFVQSAGTHTTNDLSLAGRGGNSAATYDLNGGTLAAGAVDTGFVISSSTAIFNFNGGTLQARQDNATFFERLSKANVRTGGAKIDTAGFSVTVAQPLVHSTYGSDAATDGGLTKLGNGTLNLTGSNTYTGATTVSRGTLLVNNTAGSGTGTGMVNVTGGATLGGAGRIGGSLSVATLATLSPGNGPGRLTVDGNVGFASGAVLTLEIGGLAAGSQYDQVAIGGALNLQGAYLTVRTVNGFALVVGETFYVLDLTGNSGVTGSFSNAPGGIYTDAAGERFFVNYAARNPVDADFNFNDVSLTALPVPEPGTWALLGMGVGGLLIGGRVRQARKTPARAFLP